MVTKYHLNYTLLFLWRHDNNFEIDDWEKRFWFGKVPSLLLVINDLPLHKAHHMLYQQFAEYIVNIEYSVPHLSLCNSFYTIVEVCRRFWRHDWVFWTGILIWISRQNISFETCLLNLIVRLLNLRRYFFTFSKKLPKLENVKLIWLKVS